ncbi:anion permease [Tumebacillus sp. ITR2]|uniref:Anion permease n=1 Tax=Tumebacillus amylolyticus TaxID=2801339 RepID=A0ABS1JAF9_9BACL|nr:SLC13 family permease [Tumebacillus amylolyticus]MBL0386593.1 anion permease [Tumebacillus amylolyticus]
MSQLSTLSAGAWETLSILVLVLLLLVTNKVRIDFIGIFILLALGIGGLVKEEKLFAGFGSEAVIVIAAMLAIGEALVRTGLADRLASWMTRLGGRTERRLLPVMMVIVGVLSSFISDLAIVAVFLPVMLGFEQRLKIPASRLLLPLALASTLGLFTVVGSSSIIVANQALISSGGKSLSLFSVAPLGLALLTVGTLYVWLFRKWILPKATGETDTTRAAIGVPEYLTELLVSSDSSWNGLSLKDISYFKENGINIVRILREEPVDFVKPTTVLHEGDILLVTARREDLLKLRSTPDFSVQKEVHKSLEEADIHLAGEAIVRQGSVFVGRTLQQLRFREEYDVTVLALYRDGHSISRQLATTPLRTGDMLLLQGSRDAMSEINDDTGLLMISQTSHNPQARKKGPLALAVLALMLTLSATNWMPITTAAVLGVGLMVMVRIMSMNNVYRAIEWHILVFVAAMIPLSTAMKDTGLIDLMSHAIVSAVGSLGPYALLAVTFWIGALITQVLSNTATALLLAPVVIGAATTMGVNPVPFVIGIITAVNAAPITYIAHKVYLVVMAPGGYKYKDYVKFGLPMTLLSFGITMLLVPLIWPF